MTIILYRQDAERTVRTCLMEVSMNRKIVWLAAIMSLMLIPVMGACSSPKKTPPGLVVNSDSIVSAEIKAIRVGSSSSFPWDLDVLIIKADNVDDLTNPVADKMGQVVTAKTDQDMSDFRTSEMISARIKLVGDVPTPGIDLYIYDIKPQ
jgi:hypothetical protein